MANKKSPGKGKILLVDDDPGLLRLLSIRLRAEGYEVEAVESAHKALGVLNRFSPDLVITDLRMDKMDGIGLLKELQTRSPGLRVIIVTAHGTIPDAVTATQSGAFGFLTKPIDKDDLMTTVERALKVSGTADVDDGWASAIITRNQAMKEILQQAKMVAATDARVLINGESGTGKELLAQAIHDASDRRGKPFVAINCSAMAENLLESELFGHQKGAFTGATRDHKGLFQSAEGGTLLLDEIGDMPMRLQVKLLRVLQEHQVRPVGGTDAIHIDVRVISATHRDLQELMTQGKFREDLYYRLNVVNIKLPSLDDRREDIPLLVAHFLQVIAKEAGQERKVYAPEAVEMLVTAEWPGNIRQLFNVVRQNIALSRSPVISAELVQQSLGEHAGKLASFSDAREEFTRNYLSQILQITQGNV
ncbi:MAG: sigma 54-interacting transcriptional regulator, partial [Woeseiaceae bacterium]